MQLTQNLRVTKKDAMLCSFIYSCQTYYNMACQTLAILNCECKFNFSSEFALNRVCDMEENANFLVGYSTRVPYVTHGLRNLCAYCGYTQVPYPCNLVEWNTTQSWREIC